MTIAPSDYQYGRDAHCYCEDLSVGESLLEHYQETGCQLALQRLKNVGYINSTDREDVGAPSQS